MTLITLAQVKEMRGIGTTTDDTLLTNIITRVDKAVKEICKRDFEATTYTEKRNGNGLSILFTNQYPINSITSLTQIDKDSVVTYTWASTDYIYESGQGLIQLRNGTFPQGLQNIKVVYNAGFSTIPVDLQQACIEYAGWIFENRAKERVGIISRMMSDGSTLRYTQYLPIEVSLVLDRYKKFGT